MKRREPGRLPESLEHVEAVDAILRRDSGRVIEGFHRFRDFCRDNAIDSLEGVGLPLRPIFLPKTQLERIARDLYVFTSRLRLLLMEHIDDLDALASLTPFPASHLAAFDRRGTFGGPHCLQIMRPDGFLDADGYHLSELNIGNGTLISATYCEALQHYYAACSPVLEDIGSSGMKRPFLGLLELFCKASGRRDPRVAMLTSTMDLSTKEHWGLRAPQQLMWAPKRFAEMGIRTVSLHEEHLLASPGKPAYDDEGPFDCVFNVTTGLGFFDEPARLSGDLERYRGSQIGTSPYLVPLGALAFEKGILATATSRPELMDDLAFELPRTQYATEAIAPALRLEREDYVIKRSYGDKHTFVGCSTAGRIWNSIVEKALEGREYIVQDYVPLPRTNLPVLLNGEIVWLDVRVEISPFITDGVHCGTMVRYAPDDDGLILSPPPENMGFGLVCEV